jgi:hypothetical protein
LSVAAGFLIETTLLASVVLADQRGARFAFGSSASGLLLPTSTVFGGLLRTRAPVPCTITAQVEFR